MSTFTASCRHCPTRVSGEARIVFPVAREHEVASPEHLVQVWPTAAVVAPLPRELWAA